MSDIILLLLDSRCPPLHLPLSLASCLSLPGASTDTVTDTACKSKMANVILVLTKVDISGPAHVAAWTSYLNTQYPGIPVVPVEAYAPKVADPDGHAVQGRVRYKPHIAGTFRERLVHVLKDVHAKMLIPPDSVRRNSEKKMEWKPRVRTDVDWEGVLNARGAKVEKGERFENVDVGLHNETNSDAPEETLEPKFLTVGLIGMIVSDLSDVSAICLRLGQPNVGKSSLLNALFGTTMVRASRTPGKVKVMDFVPWKLLTTIADETFSDSVLDTRRTTR